MKTKVISLALIMVLLSLAPMSIGYAKDKDSEGGINVPVSGTFTDAAGGIGKFSGTFNIVRFAVVNDAIHAVGTISGTLTDSTGNVVISGLQTVSVPITASNGPVAPTAGVSQPRTSGEARFVKASYEPAAPAPAPQLSCQILRLSIGAIDLNLLGLVVHLNPVLLIITAVPGPGNLLGNLLCAIANLLNGTGPLAGIVALLNQLLALLG